MPSPARRPRPTAVAEMPFLEHLRELRRRLVISLLALIPGVVIGFLAYDPLSRFLTEPVCGLPHVPATGSGCGPLVITGSLLAAFTLQAKVAVATGVVLAAPVWLYQLWAFLAPGLHRHEKRRTLAFVAAAIPLFAAGLVLCYLLLPKGVAFLVSFAPDEVTFLVEYEGYLSLVLRLGLVFGVAFLTPVVVVGLNLVGALPAARLRRWWRGIALGIFVFAAVATPTGDPVTMLAVALPMIVLTVLAYVICAVHDRRLRRNRSSRRSQSPLSDDEPTRWEDV